MLSDDGKRAAERNAILEAMIVKEGQVGDRLEFASETAIRAKVDFKNMADQWLDV